MVIRAAIPTQPIPRVTIEALKPPAFKVELDGTTLPPAEVALTPTPTSPAPSVKSFEEVWVMSRKEREYYYSIISPEARKDLKWQVRSRLTKRRMASMTPEARMERLNKMRAVRMANVKARKSAAIAPPPIDSNKDKEADGSPVQPS